MYVQWCARLGCVFAALLCVLRHVLVFSHQRCEAGDPQGPSVWSVYVWLWEEKRGQERELLALRPLLREESGVQ